MKTPLLKSVLFFCACLSGLTAQSQNFKQTQKISAADRAAGDLYGYVIAMSGEYAISGAANHDRNAAGGSALNDAGAAYILKKGSNGHWIKAQKISPADRSTTDRFGSAVAMDGAYAVVASVLDDHDQNGANPLADAGSVYIFERNVNGVYNQVQKIVPSDRAAGDYFGISVSISGDYLLVGARQDDEDSAGLNTKANAGSAYIFKRNGSGVWVQVQKLSASDRAADDNFANDVSISGNAIAIGAFFEDDDESGNNPVASAGSVYLFEKNGNGHFVQVKKLVATKRNTSMNFGFSVTLSGNNLLITAHSDNFDQNDANMLLYAGSAYFYEKVGNNWTLVNKVVAKDRAYLAQFGLSASLQGNLAVIGATKEKLDQNGLNSLNSAGAAYVFAKVNGSWVQKNKLCASDRSASDEFGRGLAIGAQDLLVGAGFEDEDSSGAGNLADAGSVYAFKACQNITYASISPTSCAAYTSPSGNYTWDSSGVYTDVIPNAGGCDSIITITLTVNKINKGIQKSGNTLSSPATGSTFRWLRCSDQSVVPGETLSTFAPKTSGSYRVEVSKGGCKDSSVCLNIDLTSLQEQAFTNAISIYPNPGKDVFTINSGNALGTIEVFDRMGRLVYSTDAGAASELSIAPKLADGVYLFRITRGQNSKSLLITVQH